MTPKKRPLDKHTGQQYEWCACGRWIVYGTSHPTLTSCNCGAWYKPHVSNNPTARALCNAGVAAEMSREASNG